MIGIRIRAGHTQFQNDKIYIFESIRATSALLSVQCHNSLLGILNPKSVVSCHIRFWLGSFLRTKTYQCRSTLKVLLSFCFVYTSCIYHLINNLLTWVSACIQTCSYHNTQKHKYRPAIRNKPASRNIQDGGCNGMLMAKNIKIFTWIVITTNHQPTLTKYFGCYCADNYICRCDELWIIKFKISETLSDSHNTLSASNNVWTNFICSVDINIFSQYQHLHNTNITKLSCY